MATSDGLQVKHYAEQGVQTESHLQETSTDESKFAMFSVCKTPDTTHHPSSSPGTDYPVSPHSPGIRANSPQELDDSAESASISTAVRVYKRRPLQYYHPPANRTLKSVSARIVSLPETSPQFSAKKAVEKRAMRIVSLPECSKTSMYSQNSSPYSDRLDTSGETGDHFYIESQQCARVRVRSNATDMPHTPSPPSSPESIVIIADKSQLSKGFLRSNMNVEDSISTHTDDSGWISWTKSPPRPIPALHGPLSLPYARCPSGAEGTIIDEQDNLPRMIWGLEGEDMPSARPRSDSLSGAPSHPTPRKSTARTHHAQVPPRFQKPKEDVLAQPPPHIQLVDPQEQYNTQVVLSRQVPVPRYQPLHDHMDLERALPGHGPIDLSNVLRPRSGRDISAYPHLDPSNDTLYRSLNGKSHHYGVNNESALDWQTILLAQNRLQNTTVLSSSSTGRDALGGLLEPSLSSSSFESLASSRSPIILDHPGYFSLPAYSTLSQNNSRRMSALEIAQKYRQQQQQTVLPTPPNSSSPIWASCFSPYQGSLVSPDLLSVSSLPIAPRNYVPSNTQQRQHHAILQQLEVPQYLGNPGYELVPSALNKIKYDAAILAPAAPIQDTATRLQALSTVGSLPEFHSLNPLTRFLQAQNCDMPNGPKIQRSPVTRPPLDATLNVTQSPKDRRNANRSGPHAQPGPIMATPPSPTSPPKPRLRSISHQPRSIPLTQMIQRRLSSVPEEDLNALAELGRTPSPAPSPAQRSRSYSISGTPTSAVKVDLSGMRPRMLAPASPAVSTLRMPSPTYMAVVSQSKHGQATSPSVVPSRPVPHSGRSKGAGEAGRSAPEKQREGSRESTGRGGRGRGRGHGGRGKRGRGSSTSLSGRVIGPERVDGGMTVRS